ncbi:hypothetical protein I553_7291 [Mycobacterium xenopi 4042]|uniref:Uncharacterized protein n=1 Tax=Mycobacterium xenopi 4042 TaxID=1299334 RepID=X8E678_MYCXE|nr:hypothetical protein I553_7291 [Mycobacterium xenopi 4042]
MATEGRALRRPDSGRRTAVSSDRAVLPARFDGDWPAPATLSTAASSG